MKKLDLTTKHNLKGLLFIAPFLVGFALFFAFPFIQSLLYSFGKLDSANSFKLVFTGLTNYKRALGEDADFSRMMIEAIANTGLRVPVILIFSFLFANLIKPVFPGRAAFRAILFLPVILTSGIVPALESGDLVQTFVDSSLNSSSVLVSTASLQEMLLNIGFPVNFASYIMSAVTGILGVVNKSGIQILIFLAALQSISPSLYEASSIEGATAWEHFWKVTFPMVTPQLLVCLVYTIIDLFTDMNSKTMKYIYDFAFNKFQFGFSSAMSWVYFLVIIAVLGVYTLVISRFIFYYDN